MRNSQWGRKKKEKRKPRPGGSIREIMKWGTRLNTMKIKMTKDAWVETLRIIKLEKFPIRLIKTKGEMPS